MFRSSITQARCKKKKISIKNFFSKYNKIRRKLRIYLHLLKKSLMENFIFLCSGRVQYKTNSQFKAFLWLWPTTTSWNIWLPVTEELLSQCVTTGGPYIHILREVLQYSPVDATFPIHYSILETITMSCTYNNHSLYQADYVYKQV